MVEDRIRTLFVVGGGGDSCRSDFQLLGTDFDDQIGVESLAGLWQGFNQVRWRQRVGGGAEGSVPLPPWEAGARPEFGRPRELAQQMSIQASWRG